MTILNRVILFADDDVLTQWLVTDILDQAGFTVVSACRGREAVELMDDTPECDLLLIDMDLPDTISGYEIGDHWRNTRPGRPVIYTGLKPGPAIRVLEQHEYFLEKPFSRGRILNLIELALEDASFRLLPPQFTRRSQHVN